MSEGNVTEDKVAVSDTAVVEAPDTVQPAKSPSSAGMIVSSVGLVVIAVAYLWELNRMTASNPENWTATLATVSLVATVVALWSLAWQFRAWKVYRCDGVTV